MEKVLNITARLEEKRRNAQIEAYRDRFDAVQRVLQCSACQFRCAMCNRHIDSQPASDSTEAPAGEFVLCDSCRSEFEAYQRICRQGRTEADMFWHNREWMNLWACWADFQRSIREFRNSLAFNPCGAQAEEQ